MEALPLVYLSYPVEVEEEVIGIYDRLASSGFRPWMVSRDVRPGENLQARATDALSQADFFLAILSQPATQREGSFVQEQQNQLSAQSEARFVQEWEQALKLLSSKPPGTIYLIPVRLDSSPLPSQLSQLAAVNLFRPDGWDRLLDALRGAGPKVEAPVPPAGLIDACLKRDCVLYAGAELSRPAGYPSWSEFVASLVNWAVANRVIDSNLSASYLKNLQAGQTDLVADAVISSILARDPGGKLLRDAVMGTMTKPTAAPTQVHQLLQRIGFSAVLTTNLDSLLEQTFRSETFIYTLQDATALMDDLARRSFFILKLSGSLDGTSPLLVSPSQYRDALSTNRAVAEFFDKLFFSRTVFFVGVSLDVLWSNLEALQLKGSTRPHYALAGVSGTAWRARADLLQQRYNIQVLPYQDPGTPDVPVEVVDFLTALAGKAPTTSAEKAPQPAREAPWLQRVVLENIGPFTTLALDLDRNWNVLLGDNGVGKSTILRAIAAALCSQQAQPYADRLIKFGSSMGRIELQMSRGERIVTELYRTGRRADVKVLSDIQLLGTEQWLAMGFPPLRHMGWRQLKGPERQPTGRPFTTVDDLEPLASGDPDPRLDDLKQSILNLDYRSKQKSGSRAKELLDDFFTAVGQMTEGIRLEFKGVDPDTYEIKVMTDDGEVPIEAVSQGTQSLMGWVGLLLQRLYQVYERAEQPRNGTALVLIDEIDAHMHPRWQQSIVRNLSQLLPNVQFIATTHSPLIVGGMPNKQVHRYERNADGRVVEEPIDEDMTMGYADQLLTSSLFGLPTTLDKVTQQEIEKYQSLLGKSERTAPEEREFQRLNGVLALRIPVPYETPAERRAAELVDALITQQVLESTDEKSTAMAQAEQRVREKFNQLMAEARARGDKA